MEVGCGPGWICTCGARGGDLNGADWRKCEGSGWAATRGD